jgi:polyhydroxybutyrate depolymerase
MTSQRENVDDVGLVAAILDSLKKTYSVDAKRVYATGISNGGLMSQRLAIERSDLIAAIAPVAGSIAAPIAEKFAPKDPVSVIMFNGTEDPIMPFDGGVVSRDRGMVLSSKEVAAKWVERNKCKGPKHDNMPDQDPDDKCTVERDTWTGGENGTEVILYTVKGGGHTWPGGRQYAMPFLIGVASQDANATELIWDFFKKHKKP